MKEEEFNKTIKIIDDYSTTSTFNKIYKNHSELRWKEFRCGNFILKKKKIKGVEEEGNK